jgi:WD40 repeat protein
MFVVHAPEDTWFVEGFLLATLSLPANAILTSSSLGLGTLIVNEIERGALSPVTVVIVSPAFLASPWTRFASELALHQSVEGVGTSTTTLVPVILADCDMPLLLRFREPLDFRKRDPEHWEREAARLRERVASPLPSIAVVPCPYPGMRPFTTEDEAHFHGRTNEVADLLGRLRDGQRELYVIGPSGSGKSSLVAAGLVPSLRQSPELAGGRFLVWQTRPGANPMAVLARALEATAAERSDAALRWLGDAVGRVLARRSGYDRLLIFVDQMEELFTIAESRSRVAFVTALRELRRDSRVTLVLALRADFYASLMESALWADLDGQLSRLDVSPLRGDRLRLAIEAPARALGIYFEPVLTERLLHDVAEEPGALPLLQDTLQELWHRRTRGLLRLAEYDAMSSGAQTGLAVMVARRADGALGALSPGHREIARRVLLRLVQLDDGVVTTRRQQTRDALATANDAPEAIDAVVRHLADHRLVTISGNDDARTAHVDLAHEVLLSAWSTLDEWLRSRRQDEQRRRVLEAKAAEWVHHGRGESRLLDRDELHEVRSWLDADKAHDLGVSEQIDQLLARSEAALEAQVVEAARHRRVRRISVVVALVVLAVAVVAVSIFAQVARRQSLVAREQLARNYIARGQDLMARDRLAQAAPYLLKAREAGIEDVRLRMLFRWALRGVPLAQVTHRNIITAVAWSPDGRRLATVADHTAEVWDAQTGDAVTTLDGQYGDHDVNSVVWTPDGRRLALAGTTTTAGVWDANSGKQIAATSRHPGKLRAIAWSPDGRRLATASDAGTTRVLDVEIAKGDATSPHQVVVEASEWSLGTRVTTANGARWLAHQGVVETIAWSQDGRRLATAGDDRIVRVWDATSGEAISATLAHQNRVDVVAWSADGQRLATSSDDRTVRVWDATTGSAGAALEHAGAVFAVAWSPDGRRLATVSDDYSVRVWDAERGNAVTTVTHAGRSRAVAWSPDGQRLATASDDKTARVWDANSGEAVTPALEHTFAVTAVAWRPDGRRLATASDDYRVRVWDVAAGVAGTPGLAHRGTVRAVAWSPDQRRLATASDDHTARVWDPTSGHLMTTLVHADRVRAVSWSPNRRYVATASDDHTARVWDAESGKEVTPALQHSHAVRAIAWSPDGQRLATACADYSARVWDASSGMPITRAVPPESLDAAAARSVDGALKGMLEDIQRSHERTHAERAAAEREHAVWAVAWSPDGTRLLTVSPNDTAWAWDAISGKIAMPRGGSELMHEDAVTAVAWSPDGQRVATASRDNTARIWETKSFWQTLTPALNHAAAVLAVAWSPDGHRLATASVDGTARVWDAHSGKPVTPPLVHEKDVVAVVWSPDGRRVATASLDSTARVWDAETGEEVTPALAHAGAVLAVAWRQDGLGVATASSDSTARVWDTSWDTGSLDDWREEIKHGDYRLDARSVLVVRERKGRHTIIRGAEDL